MTMSLNYVYSDLRYNNYGVPQGSILRPLLCLLYVKDMPQAVASTPRLFADDACLLLRAFNPTSLLSTLNLEISLLLEWCNSNKLTINPQKCHLIIPPSKKPNLMDLSVSLKDATINAENSVKYLGVIIDTNLNFHDHLTAIELKILRAVGILYKLKFVLPQNTLRTLYYSFIHPHLLYGLIVWGSTYPTYLNSLSYKTKLSQRYVVINVSTESRPSIRNLISSKFCL